MSQLKRLSYSYGINLGKDKDITRKIIFENKKTYKKYSYDLGYTLDGLYEAILPDDDNLSKDKAWYDKTIDLKELPKGTYTIYITTSANITDISELKVPIHPTITAQWGKQQKDVFHILQTKTARFRKCRI